MSLGSILVATDFSEHSAAAARLGATLSASRDARVVLLHVDSTPENLPDDGGMRVAADVWSTYREATRKHIATELEEQATALARRHHVTVTTEIRHGEVAARIIEAAAEGRFDLIVMGSHGAAANERFLFGSAVSGVLREAPCPVLVTRSSQADRLTDEAGFAHPLIAVDYSKFSMPSVELALELATPTATIDLVHVWRPPILTDWLGDDLTLDDLRDLDAAADLALGRERKRLDDFRGLVSDGARNFQSNVAWGRVASVLLDHARKSGCDAIVVGAHGPHGGAELGIGSVADRVLRHSPVPILFLPETALAPEAVLATRWIERATSRTSGASG